MRTPALTVASLFAGAGGSSLGYRAAGFRVAYACELDQWAASAYRLNADPTTIVDERSVEGLTGMEILEACGGELDVLDGSPPCPPWSTMPHHGGRGLLNDPRGRLMGEYVRLVSETRPRAFVMENVVGIAQGRALRHLVAALDRLRDSGYRVASTTVDASRHGVPQARPRFVAFGFRRDLGIDPRSAFPRPNRRRTTLSDALPEIAALVSEPAPGRPAVRALRRRREWSPDQPAPTLTAGGLGAWSYANVSVVLPDGSARRPTVQELLTLAGFPPDFEFPTDAAYLRIWKALGNSVPPPLAEAWARSIADALDGQTVARAANGRPRSVEWV